MGPSLICPKRLISHSFEWLFNPNRNSFLIQLLSVPEQTCLDLALSAWRNNSCSQKKGRKRGNFVTSVFGNLRCKVYQEIELKLLFLLCFRTQTVLVSRRGDYGVTARVRYQSKNEWLHPPLHILTSPKIAHWLKPVKCYRTVNYRQRPIYIPWKVEYTV